MTEYVLKAPTSDHISLAVSIWGEFTITSNITVFIDDAINLELIDFVNKHTLSLI